jgi:dienelactone hydrolase
MAIQTQLIEYYDNSKQLEGFLAFDDQREDLRPGVLIAHTWAGRDQAACDNAIKLAKLGYVGFAADMYGKGVLGTNPEQNADLMQPFIDNRAYLQSRMMTALETLRQLHPVNSAQVAAIGYCFGGLCVIDLARTGIKLGGVISMHGLLNPPDNIGEDNRIRAKMLVLHGYEDPLATPHALAALQKELTDAKADWQTHIYGNTMHAFTNPKANDAEAGTVYNALADQRSWQSMIGFLDELFTPCPTKPKG